MRTRGWCVKSRVTDAYIAEVGVPGGWWVDKADRRIFLTRFEAFAARNAFYEYFPDGIRGVHVVRITSCRRGS